MKKTKTIPTLTPREREVLALLADGYDNEETGKILTLSRRTIEAHRSRIMSKLDMHNLASLVKYSIKNELTTIDKHRSDSRLA